MDNSSIKILLQKEAAKHNMSEIEAYKALGFTKDFLGIRLEYMEACNAVEGAIEDMKSAYSTIGRIVKYYEKENK